MTIGTIDFVIFVILGLPNDIIFDEEYSTSPSLKHEHYKFSGYTNSFVKYTARKEWYIGIYGDNTTYATTDGTDYPMGTHMWKIVSPSSTRMVEMNFNACLDKNEYNCADGACIPIESRRVALAMLLLDYYTLYLKILDLGLLCCQGR